MINQRILQIAKVKAAIFESRDVEKLISQAIRAYRDPRLNETAKGEITIYFGENNENEIVIRNVPLVEYEGNYYENLQLTAELEELLEVYSSDNNPIIQKSAINLEELIY